MVFRFREAELNWRQELAYQRAETSWRAAPWRVRLIR